MGARQERDGFRMTRPHTTPPSAQSPRSDALERAVEALDGIADRGDGPWAIGTLTSKEARTLLSALRSRGEDVAAAEARAVAARWKAVADELARAAHNARRWFDPRDTFGNFTNSEQVGAGLLAALALYDAAKKESGESGMVPVADANAAIHKLQKELDRKERENR